MANSNAAPARKPIIAGNWKMHQNHLEAIQLTQKLSYALEADDFARVDVVLCPPFTDIRSLQTLIDADKLQLQLGAQHCHWETHGAFTGEVSPTMLAKLSCRFVIVGHSERRELFGETDEQVNRKVAAVINHGMTPILCVGETLSEREEDATKDKIAHQVTRGFAGVKPELIATSVVAYEPIWAIGTGRTATAQDANDAISHLRTTIGELAGSDAAASVRIQYGGSVKSGNVRELMEQPDIDGALVGGASLNAEEFVRIIRYDPRS